jgi:hypothetical protein
MSQLVVVGFNQLDHARDAMRRLRDLEKADRIKFEDTASSNGRRTARPTSGTRPAGPPRPVPWSVRCLAGCSCSPCPSSGS